MTEQKNPDEMRQKVREMIKDVAVCMFVTVDEDGRLRSRPMRAQVQPDSDGKTFWFFTQADTPKTDEIGHDGRVLLGYSNPSSQDYVSVYGKARVVQDKEQQKKLWSEPLRVWFPGGPESPEVALIAVTAEGAEYWDSPSSAVVHAYGYVKALATGTPPKAGENEKVTFTGT